MASQVWRKRYTIRAPEETTARVTICTYPGPERQIPTRNRLPLLMRSKLLRGTHSTSRYHAAQMLRIYRTWGYVITVHEDVR